MISHLSTRWKVLLVLVGPPLIGLLSLVIINSIIFLGLGHLVGNLLTLTLTGWILILIVGGIAGLVYIARDVLKSEEPKAPVYPPDDRG